MKALFFNCPGCRAKFDSRRVIRNSDGRSFDCPNCGRQLDQSAADKWTRFIAWFIISVLITYFLGIRDPLIFVGATVFICYGGAIPFALIMRRIFPPKLELYYPENLSLNISKRR